MLDFIGFTEHDSSNQHLYDFTANVSGDLFDLPAGPVDVAFGYEHRFQSAQLHSRTRSSAAGLGADIPAQPAQGHYNVDEFYGEIRVPDPEGRSRSPTRSRPTARSAIRIIRSAAAARPTPSPACGSRSRTSCSAAPTRPVSGRRALANCSVAGRASICRSTIPARTSRARPTRGRPAPTVRANCIANGVPADRHLCRRRRDSCRSSRRATSDLKPEKSRNLTFGAVYSPRWARNSNFASNLSLEVNYYDIKVTDAIGAVDPNLTLNNCALLGDAASCALVTRTAQRLRQRNRRNAARTSTASAPRAIDAKFNYRSPPTSIGRFGLSANATWLRKYVLTASNGFVVLDRRGTERGSPDQAFPKFKGNATIDWSLGDFAASFTGRYIDDVTEIDPDTAGPKQARQPLLRRRPVQLSRRRSCNAASPSRSASTICSTRIRRPASSAA